MSGLIGLREALSRRMAEAGIDATHPPASPEAWQLYLTHLDVELTGHLERTYMDRRAAAARLAALIRNLHAGVLVEDERHRVMVTNRLFCDLWAIHANPEDLVGTDAREVSDHAARWMASPDLFRQRMETVLRERKMVVGDQIRRADGRVIERDYLPIIVDGQDCGHLWLYRDVTQRARVEARLRESEERFRILSEAAWEGILIHEQGRTVDANEAAASMFGRPVIDIIGRDATEFVAADSREQLTALLHQGRGEVAEAMGVRGDGTTFPLEVRVRAFRSGDRSLQVIAFHDISERHRAEGELRRAKEIAEAASRAKDGFLAMMSHELRTPLNGALGMTELLLESSLDREQRDGLLAIRRSGETLLTLINDLLDYSKIEAGKFALSSSAFDPAVVLDEACSNVRETARRKGISLEWSMGDTMPAGIQSDPVRLKQAISNLVSNAVKFTEKGGVDVHFACTGRDGDELMFRLSVHDTGIGIPRDVLDRLFVPFTQADASTSRKYGGTGLGLAITKQLVEMMGGGVGVESVVDRGSTFWFTFRARAAEVVEVPLQPARSSERLAVPARVMQRATGRVLLVEDDEVNQTIAMRMLRMLGFAVDAVTNGLEGVEAAQAERYDAILMDCSMPVLDGFGATRRIRAAESSGQRVPIIAMTANAMRGDRERCLDAGMTDYLTKPVSLARLRATMERWVGGVVPVSQMPTRGTPLRLPAVRPDDREILETLDVRTLEEITQLPNSGEADRTARELSSLFCNDARERIGFMRAAIARSDETQVGRQAHALKGAAGNFGARRMARLAEHVEEALRTRGVAACTPLLDEIDAERLKVEAAMEAWMERRIRAARG